MPIEFNQTLDVRGAKCPMPLVKTRKAFDQLPLGEVLQVITTDRGSIADFQGWARAANNVTIVLQEAVKQAGQDVYIHYLRRKG